MLPSVADLGHIHSVDDLLQFLQVPDPTWAAFTQQSGDPRGNIRVLAALPKAVLLQCCYHAVFPDGTSFTATQASHVGLMWRTARRLVHLWAGEPGENFIDVDPWEAVASSGRAEGPESQGSATANNAGGTKPGGGLKENVLKMANLLDQTDDSELHPASRDQVQAWQQCYLQVMGAPPQEEEDVTDQQLAALNKRIHVQGMAPYVDFSVWLPFGRKAMKSQKFRTYFPLGDGSYLMKDLPGPQSFQQWLVSWRVFKTGAIMLSAVSLASLQLYERAIEKLVIQWPKVWGLICAAEDKARAERLEKLRRKFDADEKAQREVPRDWDPDHPWTCCFRELAGDEEYWNEQVRHPATAWMVSGARGSPIAPAEAMAGAHFVGSNAGDVPKEENTDRKRQAYRDRRLAKAKRIKNDREELEKFRSRGPSDGGFGGAKGSGKGKTKDQSGNQICFSFASGTGQCGSLAIGAECAQKTKRAHKCQFCLSPGHRNADCPQRK